MEVSEGTTAHVHFDCFGGATERAMLAACCCLMDGDGEERHNNDNRGRLVHDLERRIQQGLAHIKLKDICVSKTLVAAAMSATLANLTFSSDEKQDDTVQLCWSMTQIRNVLSSADAQYIPESVCRETEMVFVERMTAKNLVHGSILSEDKAVFSVDCIVHVVAVLLALHLMHVQSVSCGPLPLGEGSFESEKDGLLLPVPSPETLQLVVGMPTCFGPTVCACDMITPTAAALLRVLQSDYSTGRLNVKKRPHGFTMDSISVGADVDGSEARVLRVWLGHMNVSQSPADTASASLQEHIPHGGIQSDPRWKMDELTQLEANLDDMTAEALAFAVEVILKNGALDAWVTPIVMKKGRAAHTFHCLCHSNNDSILTKLLELIFRHTTTLGIRIVSRNIGRAALRRSFLTVPTPFGGDVRAKFGYLGDEIVSIKAEFDDCARLSRQSINNNNTPIQQIADFVTREAATMTKLENDG